MREALERLFGKEEADRLIPLIKSVSHPRELSKRDLFMVENARINIGLRAIDKWMDDNIR